MPRISCASRSPNPGTWSSWPSPASRSSSSHLSSPRSPSGCGRPRRAKNDDADGGRRTADGGPDPPRTDVRGGSGPPSAVRRPPSASVAMILPALTLALPLLAALAASLLSWRPTLRMAMILACLGLGVLSLLVQAPDERLPVLGGAAFVLTPLNRTLLAILHLVTAMLLLAGWRWRGPALTYALLTFAAA